MLHEDVLVWRFARGRFGERFGRSFLISRYRYSTTARRGATTAVFAAVSPRAPPGSCKDTEAGGYEGCEWYSPGFCWGPTSCCSICVDADASLLTAGGAVLVASDVTAVYGNAEVPEFLDSKGIWIYRDCRDRIVAHAYTTEQGDRLRKQSRVISI